MTYILPISDLRNKFNKVARLCTEGEPVFVTRHGEGELVVMSQELFDQMNARLELYQKLEEAEQSKKSGKRGTEHSDLMKRLRSGMK
ncbi:MAG: type II toxin-antitoxin system prevent-host-death family antitoxin [Deltaproteobacteria bacterium]|nr:type II toxin-antitoxin system prevent-host-death family antitoxin [Deltaproteobacteria bacterium]